MNSSTSTSRMGDSIENHGVSQDDAKSRIKCNYCAKVVPGFNRLKHHLGGVGHDVLECKKVPDDIKLQFRTSLLEKKKEKLQKQVGTLSHPELPLKRNLLVSPSSSETRRCQPRLDQQAVNSAAQLCFPSAFGAADSAPETSNVNRGSNNDDNNNAVEPMMVSDGGAGTSAQLKVEGVARLPVKEEVEDDPALVASRSVGRFFYEAGMDLECIELPSFKPMIDAAVKCGSGFRVPGYDDLNGWILQDVFAQVRKHVADVKKSWVTYGCSILLDCWKDRQGRSLIRFLAGNIQGTVFLRSVDASDAVADADALFLLLTGVVEEVGAGNVVQVINHQPNCYMDTAGKKLSEKYDNIFWTVCADYCIDLILERISALQHVQEVLAKAETITKFIYSHLQPLQLMRRYTDGRDLVRKSELKSAASFRMLDSMMRERENLMDMFDSPTWRTSTWASKTEGKAICDLVKSPSFWASAADVLKVTSPLIRLLHRIQGTDPIGILYESMDRVKEDIKMNLGGEEELYLPFWTIVDDIWNNCLHSPLHCASYYLNPSIFYSPGFYCDPEVLTGLLYCFTCMTGDKSQQQRAVKQLEAYSKAKDAFSLQTAIENRSIVPPGFWWSIHGYESPELKKIAMKILHQTCSTAARHKLNKELSENVHAKERNCIDQQKYADLEFVHYNLRLWGPSD